MNNFKTLGMGLIASIASFSAQAGLVDQFPAAISEYANASVRGAASVNVYITGAGVNRSVVIAHSGGWSSTYWRGEVSPEHVTVNGVGKIAVNVDTCAYTPSRTWSYDGSEPCGQIDVTFTKGDFLWRTNGSLRQDWDPLVNTVIGGITAFGADVSGYVKGVDMANAFRPAMGIYTNVNVVVELPDAAN